MSCDHLHAIFHSVNNTVHRFTVNRIYSLVENAIYRQFINIIRVSPALSLSIFSGDVLSGVCFVGQLDSHSLGVFLLFPLCIYLALGAIFLMAGFISLFRIRTVMKIDGKRTDKLERLMIRIGFFSGLFILPAIGLLGCLFYEYYNLDAWMLQWIQDMCIIFSIPCPFTSRHHEPESRPIFVIFMIKYVCSMLVGTSPYCYTNFIRVICIKREQKTHQVILRKCVIIERKI